MSANNINDQDYEDQVAEGQDDAAYDESYDEADAYPEDDAEEWADGDDVDAAAEDDLQPPQKKKSSVLTVIIILVVAIVGVLGFMVLKGGNAPAPQTPADQAPVAINADPDQPTDTTAPAPVATTDSGTEPQQGIMDNPATLKENANNDAPVSTQPDVTNDASAVPTLPEGTQPADSKEIVSAISPSVKPVSDFPTVDSIKKPGSADSQGTAAPVTPVDSAQTTDTLPIPSEPVAAQPSMTAPTPQTTAPAVDDAKFAQVQNQLTAAQQKISQLEKSLSDKSAELATEKAKDVVAPSPVVNNDEEVDALKAKVAQLEAKLAQKQNKAVAAIPERSAAAQVDRSNESDTIAASQPAPVKKPVLAKAKSVKQNWSLKSASSSKAILSDKTTGDLKTVHVGDSVNGLGRIVSISNATSAWVVKGTLGSVTE